MGKKTIGLNLVMPSHIFVSRHIKKIKLGGGAGGKEVVNKLGLGITSPKLNTPRISKLNLPAVVFRYHSIDIQLITHVKEKLKGEPASGEPRLGCDSNKEVRENLENYALNTE